MNSLQPKCSCQQDELYAAETNALPRTNVSAEELQSWIDDLREMPYFERNFPNVLRIEAYNDHNRTTGSVGWFEKQHNCGIICMADCHMHEQILLHEVAHVLAAARYGSHSHDPWFARTYLELVYSRLGSEAYAALKDAFDRGCIDYDTDNAVPAGREM